MKIFDITLPLSGNTPVWDGDESVKIQKVLSLSKNSDFNISHTEFGVHSGTHIDAPFHISNTGISADKIPLEKLIGPAQVIRISDSVNLITKETLIEGGFLAGVKRLLLKTRNSKYWLDDPFNFHHDFVAIDSSAAAFLVEEGVWLIGIDYFSISPLENLVEPHQILLSGEVVILENAFLTNVEPGIYNLVCLPLNLIGTDGAPVRAVLIKD